MFEEDEKGRGAAPYPAGGDDLPQTPAFRAALSSQARRTPRKWGCRGIISLPVGFGEAGPPRAFLTSSLAERAACAYAYENGGKT